MRQPLAWWLKVGRSTYPTLFKIAFDFLSIPCTSCNCKRAFSTAKRTVTVDRNSLCSATFEALQLQKNWLRNGVVQSELTELTVHIERLSSISTAPTELSTPITLSVLSVT